MNSAQVDIIKRTVPLSGSMMKRRPGVFTKINIKETRADPFVLLSLRYVSQRRRLSRQGPDLIT